MLPDVSRLRIEPLALPPLVLVHQHGAQLGQPVRRVIERGQDDRLLAHLEAKQLDLVTQGSLEPVGQFVAARAPDDAGELRHRVGGHGYAGEHHAGEHRSRPIETQKRLVLRGQHRGSTVLLSCPLRHA